MVLQRSVLRYGKTRKHGLIEGVGRCAAREVVGRRGLIMKEHVGFNPPELCECCDEDYQYRNGLCFDCWIDGKDRRGEERHDCNVIERQERREAND